MSIALVTGSAGLIGSETCRRFHAEGYDIVGIDNDLRAKFFGAEASTALTRTKLEKSLKNYRHEAMDIRDNDAVNTLFAKLGSSVKVVVHTAAQPSHDWAAREPHTDFSVNAVGTLNLLEATRQHCPDAVFIFTSTNKVYGDTPNLLPLRELELRWEIDPTHAYHEGIDETMSIDQTKHSLFGASKVAADVLVQEYGDFSRRLSHWPGARRHGAARLPRLPDEMHRDRPALSRVRLQGQTGARQHPQPRSRGGVLAIHFAAAFRRSL